MRLAASGTTVGTVLSAALFAIAVLFAFRQRAERQRRPADLEPLDRLHFAWQDIRRLAGSVVMALIAVGLVIGTRVNVRAEPWKRHLFAWVWIVVTALVIVLLVLAFVDALATVSYARRQRRALIDERVAAIVEERRKLSRRNGPGSPHGKRAGPSA